MGGGGHQWPKDSYLAPYGSGANFLWHGSEYPLDHLADGDISTIAIASCPWRSCNLATADLSSIYLSVALPHNLTNTSIGHVKIVNRPGHAGSPHAWEYSFKTATVWVNTAHGSGSDHLCGKITVDPSAYSHPSEVYTVWCDGATGKHITVKLETHNLPPHLWGSDVLHSQPYLALAEIVPYVKHCDATTGLSCALPPSGSAGPALAVFAGVNCDGAPAVVKPSDGTACTDLGGGAFFKLFCDDPTPYVQFYSDSLCVSMTAATKGLSCPYLITDPACPVDVGACFSIIGVPAFRYQISCPTPGGDLLPDLLPSPAM